MKKAAIIQLLRRPQMLNTETNELSFMEKQIGIDLLVHGNLVLVKSIALPEKTKSGIILPEIMRKVTEKSYHVGLIIKMGEEAYKDPQMFCESQRNIKVGDWVYYSTYERDPIPIGDHVCYFLRDERVRATIRNRSDLFKIIPELMRFSDSDLNEIIPEIN